MKLSIRLKFLLVMSGLLLVCLSFYLLMSVTVFKTDKTQLVYDLNRSQVSTLASEIETRLGGVDQSLGVIAQLSEEQRVRLIESLFSKEADVVSIQIFSKAQQTAEKSFNSKKFLETYGLSESEFSKKIQNEVEIPFEKILENGDSIWNASVPGAPPLMGFGKLVLVMDENQVPVDQWTLVAFLKLDSFLKSVSVVKLSQIQISNFEGEVLVQPDVKELVQKPSVAEDPLFKKALDSKARLSVTHLENKGQGVLAAYGKAFHGKLIVTAQAPEKEVFKIVRALTIRTFLFGSIVLTLVILAAFLLSRSLTRNIALLSSRMVEAAKGDLTSHLKLKGRDETVKLGDAFNKMIIDLKQSRDELEVMNRDLDQKVKDRTKKLEIQNQKVVEAQEALLRTARLASMGEVAGRTAHEVLNPLTSLLTRAGLTQKRVEVNYQQPLELLDEIGEAWTSDYREGGFDVLLKNWQQTSEVNPELNLFLEDVHNISEIRRNLHEQAEEISKDMKFIREEGDRIGKIIHGMRRLGNMKSEVRPQNIHQMLDDCTDIMADLFSQQRVQIVKDFQASPDRVNVDRDEFIQSITNLMRNSLQSLIEARKIKGKRDGFFKISSTIREGNIVILLEDNGVGISSENQEKLFSTHFTTKSSDEGTGLGLSISRRFIRAYDGDLSFKESRSFESTVFEIKLPILQNEQQRKSVA